MQYNYEYFSRTSNIDMTDNYNFFLQHFTGKTIIDIGCGSGRDSNFFKQQNYYVTSVDNSYVAKQFASEKYNIDVQLVDIEQGIAGKYDAIWSCASLVHMNHDQIMNILTQLKDNLKTDGLIYISLKYGNGSITNNGQTYYLYDNDMIENILELGYKLCDKKITNNKDAMNSWIEFVIQTN